MKNNTEMLIYSNRGLEEFGRTLNDLDKGLPKGRGRCFDIGSWGGCGVSCGAFLDGECGEPQEIAAQEIIEEHGEEAATHIFEKYECFKNKLSEE